MTTLQPQTLLAVGFAVGIFWRSVEEACRDAVAAWWRARKRPRPETQLNLYERALKDIAGEVPKGVLPATDVIGARSLASSVLKQGRGLKPL